MRGCGLSGRDGPTPGGQSQDNSACPPEAKQLPEEEDISPQVLGSQPDHCSA